MIKKILIAIFIVFIIPYNSFAKAPPLGTGSLVPSNIMIMLDNSGSMAWDLGGTPLSSDSFLNLPTDIETDSAGNVYVLQQGFTYNSAKRKHYRMHVFNADGELQRQMLEWGGTHNNRICGTSYYNTRKFAIHNDQIYIINPTTYYVKIDVLSLDGKCVRQSGNIAIPMYGGHRSTFSSIAVTDDYIYLGQGYCSFFCYGSGTWRSSSGAIYVYRRSDFSLVKRILGSGSYYQHNLWGDITDITINASGTKMLVASKGASSVCLHTLSGTSIGGCTKVGGRPTGRPNQNYDRTWWKAWDYGGSYPDWHYDPWGVAFDSSGNPTQDPKSALSGAFAPWGGHKGAGLGMVVQMLGILAGSPVEPPELSEFGFLIIVMKSDLMMPEEKYRAMVTEYANFVRTARPTKNSAQVRVPFQRSHQEREKRAERNSIEVAGTVCKKLISIAESDVK